MINFSVLLKIIEEIKDYSNKIGMTAIVDGEFIVLFYNGEEYIKLVPKINDCDRTMGNYFLYVGADKATDSKMLNRDFFDALYLLKKQVDAQLWDVVLKMIFTSSSSPQENLSVIYKISAQDGCEQTISAQNEKSKNEGEKSSSTNEELLTQIKVALNLQLFEDIGHKMYYDNNTKTGVLCLSSKSYSNSKKGPHFWFCYHPMQKDKMNSFEIAYIAFCLKDENEVLIMPRSYLHERLHSLNTTVRPDGTMYWHVRIDKYDNQYLFRIPNKGHENIQEYVVINSTKDDNAQLQNVNSGCEASVIKIKSGKLKSIKK